VGTCDLPGMLERDQVALDQDDRDHEFPGIIGSPYSSIVDGGLTTVVDGTQVKAGAGYDNEWSYASRLADLARRVFAPVAAVAAADGGLSS